MRMMLTCGSAVSFGAAEGSTELGQAAQQLVS
jgi:hypothetical protein